MAALIYMLRRQDLRLHVNPVYSRSILPVLHWPIEAAKDQELLLPFMLCSTLCTQVKLVLFKFTIAHMGLSILHM